MKTALITGATSGIGEATARLMATQGYRLILCGRRKERLETLTNELKGTTTVHTLCFDVRDQKEVKSSIDQLPEGWKSIDILINNAGNAHGLAPLQSGDISDWDAMIDINVKGLLYVSHAVIPSMISMGSGHIINIGSIAGKEVYPQGNVYCASKSAVDAITRGMRLDLLPHRIKVTAIHPGLVETEFSLVRFKGDEERAKKTYEGMKPLTGGDIADLVLFILSRPAHVQIADLVVFPEAQAAATSVRRDS
jgi:3-hydroxy acid dehydrogenase/malonic semialdehyde reductase